MQNVQNMQQKKICSGLGTLERQNNTATEEEEETEVENIVSRTIVVYFSYCKYVL